MPINKERFEKEMISEMATRLFKNKFGQRGFGKLRSWLIIELYKYQLGEKFKSALSKE